jgi:tetratricopeptide (TPR) repeat protein
MNSWVEHAQRLFLSGVTDRSAQEKAIANCQDPEIRVFLKNLDRKNEGDLDQAKLLESAVKDEISSILVCLLNSAQTINSIWKPELIPPDERQAVFQLVSSLSIRINNLASLQPSRGRLLSLLGIGFSSLENFDDARIACNKAISIYRILVEAEPHTYLPDLAMALNCLGNLSIKIGKFSDALSYCEQAVDIRRALAKKDPEAYLLDLMMSLNNLGALFYHLRKFSEARGVYKEGVEGYRTLIETGADEYLPNLASTLNGLGNLLLKEGKFSEAHKVYEECVFIRRTLVEEKPIVFLPPFATALNSLGNVLCNIRKYSAALKAHEEALSIREILAEADPGMYLSHVASSLNNLGILHRAQSDYGAARLVYERALPILQTLDEKKSGAYSRDVANTLNNLGIVFDKIGDHPAALTSYESSLHIWRNIAKEESDDRSPHVAMTLNNLGALRSSEGDYSAAHAAYDEALSIRRALVEVSPEVYSSDLATTANSLGNLVFKEGNYENARSAYDEAISFAESARTSSHHLNIFKNDAADAYRFMLSDLSSSDVINAEQVFSICCALRDGDIRSSCITQTDLINTQKWLETQETSRGINCQILVANHGRYGEPIFGLIDKNSCEFFNLRKIALDWELLLPTIDDLSSRSADSTARHLLARQCWQALPVVIQNALLLKSEDNNFTFISGDSFWSAFPWELLRFGDSYEDYTGLHQVLLRIGALQAERLEEQLSVEQLGDGSGTMSVLAPFDAGKFSDVLFGVIDEVSAVRRAVEARGGEIVAFASGTSANSLEIENQLRLEPDIIYFSGHGAVIHNEEVLVLHDSDINKFTPVYFGKKDIELLAEHSGNGIFSQHPLIVLNSCHTGRAHSFGGAREDLVAAMLSQGAGAVIASALPVIDEVGKALGEALFDPNIATQRDIGSVVLGVRRHLALQVYKDLNSPCWGAWGMIHLHGSGLAKMPFNQ